MADVKTYSTEETIGLIKAKAADREHGDNFLVKISRKRGVSGFANGLPELVATLGAAGVEQIVNSETWLPKLVGGGTYIVRVYSEADHGKQLGGDLIHQFSGEPKLVDPNILRQSGWKGPTDLRYPEVGPQVPTPYMSLGNITAPPQLPQPSAPSIVANTLPLSPSPVELELKQQLQQMQQMLQQQGVALTQRERELADERIQRREEQLRREQAAAMSALEAKLDRMANAAPSKSPIDAITALAGTIMPLVQAMIQSSAETRQIMLKAQQDNQTQFQAIMLKSMERPTVPPEITTLLDRFQSQLDKLRESDPNQANMISQMADAFGGMTNMMVGIMSQVADSGLLGGKQEPMGMMIVKEIAKAIESFGRLSAGATKGVRRALPAARPVQQPQPRPPPSPVAATATGPQQPVTTPPPANGFAGVVNPLDEIERRILAEEDPAKIAEALIAVMGDVVVKTEIEQSGGLMHVFSERLGQDWAAEHMEYAQALLGAIQERAEAAGITTIEETGDVVEAAN